MKAKNLKVIAPVLVTVMLTGCSLTNVSRNIRYNYKVLSFNYDKQHLSVDVNLKEHHYSEYSPSITVYPDGSQGYNCNSGDYLMKKNGKVIAVRNYDTYKLLVKTPNLK